MLNKFNRGQKLQLNNGKELVIDWHLLSELQDRYKAEGWTFKGLQFLFPTLHSAPIGRFSVDDKSHRVKLVFNRKFDDVHIKKRLLGNRWDLTYHAYA